ncbi:hypothetical protein [Pallidibacillus pasinlerensis]|uniref:hypothetical protein n=1 Tax=Pallidibacillus pasinlerensis TaxID=2703818 RepID=UPI00137A96AE|nr:hypothetical protein [Pallidibacillus pasinlerensis]
MELRAGPKLNNQLEPSLIEVTIKTTSRTNSIESTSKSDNIKNPKQITNWELGLNGEYYQKKW